MLNIKSLKQFIFSMKDKKINQFKLKHKDLEILINKNSFQHQPPNKINNLNYLDNTNQDAINSQGASASSSNSLSTNEDTKGTKKNDESEIYSTIISPMVGTFYRSPAPNEQPFIRIHDAVQKKQTVCIIEAMKLMNEIESEVNGEITEILVSDGDIVDCGQALIKVKIT
uniref:Biotin carboxyl carrier protein of acetyl-CoA carboxylase n=1 Tax=Caloglossa intermedia TaxID=100879 RepID=A0A1Z1M6I9_9FLOR|nr:acetyl-CoA carboxylase biotin carboxyl carrier protein [Caloglossa intermedia]ARW61483.1 acetyl-CoA carboxylase biotin carboxyl carrier protein [Caloglossa intermedia]